MSSWHLFTALGVSIHVYVLDSASVHPCTLKNPLSVLQKVYLSQVNPDISCSLLYEMAPHVRPFHHSYFERYSSLVTSVFIPFMHLLGSETGSPECTAAWLGTCPKSQQLAQYLLCLLRKGLAVRPLEDFASRSFDFLPRSAPLLSRRKSVAAKAKLRRMVCAAHSEFSAVLPMSSGGGAMTPAAMWTSFAGASGPPDTPKGWGFVTKVKNIFLGGGLDGFMPTSSELTAAFPDLPMPQKITSVVPSISQFQPISCDGLYRTLTIVAFLQNGHETVPQLWAPVWDSVVKKMFPGRVHIPV